MCKINRVLRREVYINRGDMPGECPHQTPVLSNYQLSVVTSENALAGP